MANKISAWWSAHKPTRRRLIQLYTALLYNAHAKGFIKGEIYTGPLKNLCVPGLNCYSCPGAVGACPLGALQNALASSGSRGPWYVLGILMLLGLTFGRTICGWLCPMGLIQELLHKLPTPKLQKSRTTRILSYLKYILLAVLVIVLPLYNSLKQLPLPAFCKYVCPAGTLEGAIALLSHPANKELYAMLGGLFNWKLFLLILILLACVFIYRAFCRFLCPLGAIYGLFARLSLLGVKVEASACTHCGRCLKECKMDIRHAGDHECIHCGACKKVCPTGAIRWKCSYSAKRQLLPWLLALMLLAGICIGVNLPDNESPALSVGSEAGLLCPDFSVPLYGTEGQYQLSAHKEQVRIINFWATWCNPCVAELPIFERLQEEYGESISVIAIHSDMVTDDVEAFLQNGGWNLAFALDEDGSIMTALGVSNLLPHTLIVDANGVIVYNQPGSITFEGLKEQIDALLQ